MKYLKLRILFILLGVFAASCSSSRNLIVLLPDPDGKVGQIEVTTDSGHEVVKEAYHAVETGNSNDAPSAPKLMEQNAIKGIFAETLAAQPNPRFSFWTKTLYCKHASAELVDSSKKLLPEIIRELKSRNPIEVYLIGHADRVGPERYNVSLSHKRASSMKDTLTSAGIKSKMILISFYGETKPLIVTDDEVAEPLNRRVEIVAKYAKPPENR